MSWDYRCPKCEAMLNPEAGIVLVAARGEARVLAGFHPEPGNYEVHFPPEVSIEGGDIWTFSCPVCHADLVSAENENLCALHLRVGEERQQVLFSRIAGEHATYVVAGGEVAEQHGDHALSYYELAMSMRFI
ncbi:MAG: hypothetical protein JRI25_27520 [Deltaproteobacteria bacterium]|nr:hypothetical protein [Deltaproteobacteria bacterium]